MLFFTVILVMSLLMFRSLSIIRPCFVVFLFVGLEGFRSDQTMAGVCDIGYGGGNGSGEMDVARM